jgi:thiamine biosynthesis lipoprotein
MPILVLLSLAALAGFAYLQTRRPAPSLWVFQEQPHGIMGTGCRLILVTDRSLAREAGQILAATEQELRRLEALLSTWIEASPASRFNSVSAGQTIAVPRELLEILLSAEGLFHQTQGAFDVTARPLIELWRDAATTGVVPDDRSLQAARNASTWDHITLSDGAATKSRATTRVDIDGIAKGYSIDRAVETLRRSGASGGMVEIGGDLRVFGVGPEDEPWTVAIRSPFESRAWAEIEIAGGAVCSSGDYARFVEIAGRRYSHILDPRTGRPACQTHAVTVVAPDAATADAWATALSVLGPDGVTLLPGDVQAMLVTGAPDDYRVLSTPGFRELLVRAAFEPEEIGR